MKHRNKKPILTSSHGPYDPHTLEVVLYMLKTGRGGSAMINLGFAGREPLSQQCLEKLSEWGIPLNPSNIDVIYPYLDANGDPCCYKLERGFAGYVELIKTDCRLSIDIHGCVGTTAEDKRVIVGIGGAAPFPKLQRLGKVKRTNGVIQITPKKKFSEALTHLRDLSTEIYIQLCEANTNNGHDDNATIRAYNFALLGQMQMIGFEVDKNEGLQSLLEGEERLYVVRENIRWLPGAGANALQRMSAQKIDPNFINLHVELPTMIRKKMLLKLRELEINDSLASSSL